MPPLRLSLTISGGVPLAAYESGALSALIIASTALGEDTLVIDSIACASVCSLTGLLAARSLMGGVDPIGLFRSAWVDNTYFETLLSGSSRSGRPLRVLAAVAASVLGPLGPVNGPARVRQTEPLRLSLALTDLLVAQSDDLHPYPQGRPDATASLLNWYSVELTKAATPQDYLVLAHAVIAGLSELPDDGWGGYSARGRVDSESLERTLDLVEDMANDDDRVCLLIHPEPTLLAVASHDGRAHRKRLETYRTHLEWIEKKANASHATLIGSVKAYPTPPSMTGAPRPRPSEVPEVCAKAGRILAEREADRSDDYAALLGTLVRSESGQLARSRPFDFGGSPDKRSRQDDFALGYRTTTTWLEHRLPRYLPHALLASAVARVGEHDSEVRGNDTLAGHLEPPPRRPRPHDLVPRGA